MEHVELRQRLAAILDEEEGYDPDWSHVAAQCEELNERLRTEPETEYPDAVWHYLDDADIRDKDPKYAAWQRGLIREYVKTGAMVEHAGSIKLPWWGCVVIVFAPLAVAGWFLLT